VEDLETKTPVMDENRELWKHHVRIHDVFFTLEAQEESEYGYHIKISPKSDGMNETAIRLWGAFPDKEEGLRFLEDLKMLQIKYKLGAF